MQPDTELKDELNKYVFMRPMKEADVAAKVQLVPVIYLESFWAT